MFLFSLFFCSVKICLDFSFSLALSFGHEKSNKNKSGNRRCTKKPKGAVSSYGCFHVREDVGDNEGSNACKPHTQTEIKLQLHYRFIIIWTSDKSVLPVCYTSSVSWKNFSNCYPYHRPIANIEKENVSHKVEKRKPSGIFDTSF